MIGVQRDTKHRYNLSWLYFNPITAYTFVEWLSYFLKDKGWHDITENLILYFWPIKVITRT